MSVVRQYRIIGKCNQMRSVYIKDAKGRFVQKPIRLGIEHIVTEPELTFHVRKQAAKKFIKLVEIAPRVEKKKEEKAPEPPKPEIVPAPPKPEPVKPEPEPEIEKIDLSGDDSEEDEDKSNKDASNTKSTTRKRKRYYKSDKSSYSEDK